jgi:hypothetical protein
LSPNRGVVVAYAGPHGQHWMNWSHTGEGTVQYQDQLMVSSITVINIPLGYSAILKDIKGNTLASALAVLGTAVITLVDGAFALLVENGAGSLATPAQTKNLSEGARFTWVSA